MSDQPHPDSEPRTPSGRPGPQQQPPAPGEPRRPGQPPVPAHPQPPARPQPAAPVGPAPRPPKRPDGPIIGNLKRGLGLGTGVSLGVGAVLLVLSLAWSVMTVATFAGMAALMPGRGATSGRVAAADLPTTTLWGPSDAKHTLFAVPISGPIMTDSGDGSLSLGGVYGYEVADLIDSLRADDADGLLLLVNTPGGTVTGSKAIADAVQRYRDRTHKLVFAHVQGIAASGGMYAMAGADDIQADFGTLIGSIGVIFGPFDQYTNVTSINGGLLTGGVTAEKIEQYYLTQGKGKDVGNPFRAMSPDERQVLTEGMASEYRAFVDHVAQGRDIPADTIINDLGANLFSPEQAQQRHLIDGVLGRDAAFRHFAERAGVDPNSTKVVRPTRPDPISQLLGMSSRVPGQSLPAERAADGAPIITSTLCTGRTTVLAWHGNLAAVCR